MWQPQNLHTHTKKDFDLLIRGGEVAHERSRGFQHSALFAVFQAINMLETEKIASF